MGLPPRDPHKAPPRRSPHSQYLPPTVSLSLSLSVWMRSSFRGTVDVWSAGRSLVLGSQELNVTIPGTSPGLSQERSRVAVPPALTVI